MHIVSEQKNNDNRADIEKAPKVKTEKFLDVENNSKKDKNKGKVDEPVLKTIPTPRIPFS